MNIPEIWHSRFAAGHPVPVSQADVVQLLWYDGLVLGCIPENGETLCIAFVSESADKRSRFFVGYLLAPEVLEPEEADFLRLRLLATNATATEDPDKYEIATTRLLDRWRDASGYILIHSDPAFTKVFRSRIMSKTEVEEHWCKMETFYALSDEARTARHGNLVRLLGE